MNGPFFPCGDVKDERRNVSSFLALKPWSSPKGGFYPISHRDCCRGVEKVHVFFRTRVSRTGPNFVRARPLEPWPSQSQGSSKFVGMKDPEATKGSWPTNGLPIDLALPARNLVGGRPKESTFNFVKVGDEARWNDERRQVIDGLGGEDRLNKGSTVGHGHESTIPSGDLARTFILEVLEVNFSKSPYGKW